MRVFRRHHGFSMLEVLTAVAIIAVLVSLVLGLGKRIKDQAQERLCKSAIDIISSALEQYYDQYTAFPFTTDPAYGQANLIFLLETEFNPVTSSEILPADVCDEYASSEALYYYLDKKCPNSRKLIDKLAVSLTAGGRKYLVDSVDELDLIRFVDPWGRSLMYTYSAGDVFPVVASAGADGDFDTGEDNIIND